MCDVPERLRIRAAPSMTNPAINRSPASPNGSVESKPVEANSEPVAGVAGVVAVEAGLVPCAFVAVTVKV